VAGSQFGLGGQPDAVAVAARSDIVAKPFAQGLIRRLWPYLVLLSSARN
jgi:hypothetical protein